MALNYVWLALFLIGILVGVVRLVFMGDTAALPSMMDSTFEMSKYAFDLTLGLTGTLTLWMGVLKVGEDSGLVSRLAHFLSPVLTKLFPDIPKNHPALGSIFMNVAANMLGLDNAATPCGLKAMQELQSINDKKDTASNAMIMFLVLNTSGLTIIPVSIMAYRSQAMLAEYGSQAAMTAAGVTPTDCFIPLLLTTMCSTLMGLVIVSIYQKINLFRRAFLVMFAVIGALVAALFWTIYGMQSSEEVQSFCNLLSSILILGAIAIFLISGMRKKLNVYASFIEGAKGGFTTAVSLIPYCVAILAAIGVFKASGSLQMVQDGVRWCVDACGLNSEWVDALPVAMLKPLNGAGARGMMLESWSSHGTCSFVGHLTSVLQGSTDTTFYILAIYFGSVGIKKYRYSVSCGLLADLAGMVGAVLISYFFWGGKSAPQVVAETKQEIVLTGPKCLVSPCGAKDSTINMYQMPVDSALVVGRLTETADEFYAQRVDSTRFYAVLKSCAGEVLGYVDGDSIRVVGR